MGSEQAAARPTRPVHVYLSAGSNVAPVESLARALAALADRFADLQVSGAYANAAVGFVGADFINLAAGFTTGLALQEVLAELRAIEELCGRGRSDPQWAPRRMDLDVLLYDDLIGEFPGVKLPRPDLLRRAYMLGPLAEIAPQVVHPTERVTIGELWARYDCAAHRLRPVELPGAGRR